MLGRSAILCTLLLAAGCQAGILSDIGNDIKNLFDGSPSSGPSPEPALALAPGLASEPYQELHDLVTNASGGYLVLHAETWRYESYFGPTLCLM